MNNFKIDSTDLLDSR